MVIGLASVGGMSSLLVAVISLVLIGVGGGVWWLIFNGMYSYSALIYQETGSGGFFVWSKARIFVEDNVKIMRVWKFRDVGDLPPPTLDTIVTMSGGKPTILLWRDVDGNIHPVRWTRFVPVFVEKEDELVQLEQEVSVISKHDGVSAEVVKKQGWFSKLLRRPVRQVVLSGGEKRLVGVSEILFEPDNRSARVFMAQNLRKIHEKHNVLPWYKEPWFIMLVSVSGCILAIIITGYFVSDIWKANIDKVASITPMLKEASDKIGNALHIVGG
jgi:hypothetical protein